MASFDTPQFWNYPPSFTLQPVKETQEKQRALWADLVLRYCAAHRIFFLSDDDSLPLFANEAIDRRASPELRAAILSDLVAQGSAKVIGEEEKRSRLAALVGRVGGRGGDAAGGGGGGGGAAAGHPGVALGGTSTWQQQARPAPRRVLLLWRSVDGWAAELYAWARSAGLEGQVVSLEELLSGDEVRGSSVEGLPRELIDLVLGALEKQGRAKRFGGGDEDDEGVKFF